MTVIVLAIAPAHAQRRVEIYKARHRTADELLPLATAVLGPSPVRGSGEDGIASRGEVALDAASNSLVLIGDGKAVAEALAVLTAQDRRPRTIVLRHARRRVRSLEAQGLSIGWRAVAGGLRVGTLGSPRRADTSLDLRARQAMHALSESMTAQIRMTEGGRTRIETGTVVPYNLVGPSGASTRFVDATTGFEAGARILGDGRVQVELASFARELLPAGTIGKTAGSSVVTLQPGVVTAIAGLESEKSIRRAHPGATATSAESADETILLLRADLE
ncbi:hypothetical protein K2X89_10885 [Myxococcota bacterium]|nr:hypothetical protein [Myxococcota bacterium]